MSRVSHTRLVAIAEGLTSVERQALDAVALLKLVSHGQFARLLRFGPDASAASTARMTRRTLAGLTELGVLGRLQRRIGGVRAGSSGHVYYLGPVGQRLLSYLRGDGLVRGRVRPGPGGPFVRHRLSVSELYVRAVDLARTGDVEILSFDVEPECWRSSLDEFGNRAVLKPDAYLRVAAGAYEDRWFIEVDLGTESRTVLARKARAYLDHFHSGTEQADDGVFPRVLFAVSSEARRAALVDILAGLSAEYWSLFAATTLEGAMPLIATTLETEAHESPSAGGSS